MKIKVRFFAAMRDIFQTPLLELELPDGASVQDMIDKLREQTPAFTGTGALHVAINKRYARWDEKLKDGDEVAIFPPVAGGQDRRRFWITREPLSLDAMADLVNAPDRGAIVLFSGIVRGVTGDLETDHLEYEAYEEMAPAMLAQIGAEVQEKWPQIADIAIVHRIGRMEVGESSVMIAVAAAHRQGVFEACSYAIERLKRIVPVWKKEVGPDGSFWVEGPQGEGSPPTF
ncbi:MAG: molybdopterin converting factor subunit 1 [Chloroflexi bacterium]|nr:molybdopterin converting factor subunit 1 [Chloroflexota bacterium]